MTGDIWNENMAVFCLCDWKEILAVYGKAVYVLSVERECGC